MSNTVNSRVALYKEAMSLEEKRSVIQADLDRLIARLGEIQDILFAGESVRSVPVSVDALATARPTAKPMTAGSSRRRGKRARRGELKEQILRALHASGSAGVRVKDLAASIGTKPANVHSWFQAARSRIAGIKKIGEAHYRIEGTQPQPEVSGKKEKVKSAKPVKGQKKATRPLSGRGELAARILAALREAGPAGVKISALASKLGVKNRNLFIWFSTTAKAHKGIKKIGPAHYRLQS